MDGVRIYNPICCIGVTLPEPFLSDKFDPNSVTKLLEPEHRALTQSIGEISPEGTCFIIAKTTRPLRLKNNKVVALALTNYHIAYDYEDRTKSCYSYINFRIDSQQYRYDSKPLLELNSILSEIQYSKTNGMPYCLPNDISLILIIDNSSGGAELEEIEICNQEELMDAKNAIVSGFPIFPEYKYILPDYDEENDYRRKIYKGFHKFNYQIISEGSIQISESGLADLTLSATSGMSGSPILVKIGNNFKCIGIYCGASPLKEQYLLMKVLDCVNNGNYGEALSLFEQLLFENHKSVLVDIRFRYLKISFYQFMMLNNVIDQDKIEVEHSQKYEELLKNFAAYGKDHLRQKKLCEIQKLIKELLIETTQSYREECKLTYNAGISINTEAFKFVRRAIEVFRHIEGDFDNVKDIEIIIRQFIA